jgi:hypothetical protein
MKVEFVLFAEAVNKSSSGTLNILGEFNTLFSTDFPFVRPGMVFWIRLHTGSDDTTIHKVVGELVRKGNSDLKLAEFETTAERQANAPGGQNRGDIIVTAYGLVFPEPGEYEVNVYIDGALGGTKSLFVQPTPVATR